jgi:hypothetical protein
MATDPDSAPAAAAAATATAARTPTAHCELRNQTPNPLTLVFAGDPESVHTLAPLATRRIVFDSESAENEARNRLRGLHEQQIIRITDVVEASDDSVYLGFALWAVVGGVFGAAILSAAFPEVSGGSLLGVTGKTWLTVGSPATLLVLLLLAYLTAKGKLTPWLRRTSMSLRHLFTLALVMSIATALPSAALALFAQGSLTREGWANGMQLLSVGRATGLGLTIVFTFVCVAAALPGLLYFLFDRKRVTQLRENFEQQIFRLDRQVHTLADVQARYGSRLHEIWGDANPDVAGRWFSGSQWPVVLCTLVIAGGWTVIVLFTAIQNELKDASDLPALLRPLNSNYAFGFLGAYYFALGMIARRYTRGDLQPKAYSMVTARVLVVLVSAAVVSAVVGESWGTWLFLFVVGVLPETFLVFVRESIGAKFRRNELTTDDRLPLTRLEGIDLYDRARLAEEGVANLDNLAHGDLVDLMLNTSIPTPQLVEWVDQAMLYLRVHNNPGDPDEQNPDKLWHELRAMGVRRASDLIDERGDLRLQIVHLAQAQGRDGAFEARLRVLVDLLRGDEWFDNVRHWRRSEIRGPQVWTIDREGRACQSPTTDAL